jgi:hypothetical protein
MRVLSLPRDLYRSAVQELPDVDLALHQLALRSLRRAEL